MNAWAITQVGHRLRAWRGPWCFDVLVRLATRSRLLTSSIIPAAVVFVVQQKLIHLVGRILPEEQVVDVGQRA